MNLSAEQITALLQEMMARLDHPLPEMRPVEIELKDPLARETNTKAVGWTRKVTGDITIEFYEWLKTLPDNAILKGFIWLEEAVPAQQPEIAKKEKRSAKEKGPHGKFWQEMVHAGINTLPEFQAIFDIQNPDKWNEEVRAKFGKSSLTFVSPEEAIQYVRKNSKVEDGFEIDPSSLMDKINNIAKKANPSPTMPKGRHFSPADILGVEPKKLTFVSATPESPLVSIGNSGIHDSFIEDNQLF